MKMSAVLWNFYVFSLKTDEMGKKRMSETMREKSGVRKKKRMSRIMRENAQ